MMGTGVVGLLVLALGGVGTAGGDWTMVVRVSLRMVGVVVLELTGEGTGGVLADMLFLC